MILRQKPIRPTPRPGVRYIGTRSNSRAYVVVQTADGRSSLEPRLDLIRHAPAGFDWAPNSGSGPAQLALALLAHASGDDNLALAHYEVFNHEIISRLPSHRWELTAQQVLQMLHFITPAIVEESDPSEIKTRKTAVIRALLPGRTHDTRVNVQGCGRSLRGAATRALLNLLGNKHLRQRPIVNLQIELSVINTGAAQDWTEDELWDSAEGH
jgi:Family of unknown function (DUF6166)